MTSFPVVLVLMIGLGFTHAYKAAYVEHHATSACGSGSCGEATKRQNVQALQYYAQEAAAQGAQIIVFPEYGITGESSYSASSWWQGGYTESFGSVGHIPCDDADAQQQAPSVAALSCAARQNKIVIVANLAEWASGALYNTDVVLDSDGTLIAKYRKLNLWGESYMTVPQDCPIVNFTAFGEVFGLFTCADLIYSFPAETLVQRGIKNFVMPAAWSDEMAQMQVMAYAQGWSYRHQVNLILCNHRMASQSGSGIWASGQPLSTSFYPANADGGLKVSEVHSPAGPEGVAPVISRAALNGTHAQRLGIDLKGSAWQFTKLAEGAKLCSGAVCCKVHDLQGPADGYVLAALDGSDDDQGYITWGAKICAVLPCNNGGQRGCLSYQPPSGELRGLQLSAEGIPAAQVVPEVVAHSQQEEWLLAPRATSSTPAADTFNVSTAAGLFELSATTSKTITSIVIYGRTYDKDPLPYKCPQ